MLGQYWRLSVNNQCGVNVTVTVQARLWKFTSGALAYNASEVEVYNETAIASSSTAWTADATQNNSSDLYIGADFEVVVTPASSVTNSPTTNVTVQLQKSTDGGTTWPDAGLGTTILQINMPTGSSAVTAQAEV